MSDNLKNFKKKTYLEALLNCLNKNKIYYDKNFNLEIMQNINEHVNLIKS